MGYRKIFEMYREIVCVLTWIRRLCLNARNKLETRRKGELSVEEIENLETTLTKLIQPEIFTDRAND